MDALAVAGRLAAASVSDRPSASLADGANADQLLHVMRAVEGAEATIRNQLEENNRLKEELMQKTRQLQSIREDAASQASSSGVAQDRRSFLASKMDASRSPGSAASSENSRTISILQQNGALESGQPSMHQTIRQKYHDSAHSNGASKRSSGEQPALDSAGVSQFSTPSSRSVSPTRHRKEGEYDPRLNLAGQGLLPASEMTSNMSWKQDLTAKIKENEEEIAQLRKHLADYSVKQARILNDKYMLERRIAQMRMAFDQQQQDLIDAASKALSYRQDIIEENIRLTYAVQVVLYYGWE